MPVLTDAGRLLVVEEMFDKSTDAEIDSLTEEQLLAAVVAADQWIVDNQAAFNAALPQPARSILTARQKAWMFFLILRRRWRVNA